MNENVDEQSPCKRNLTLGTPHQQESRGVADPILSLVRVDKGDADYAREFIVYRVLFSFLTQSTSSHVFESNAAGLTKKVGGIESHFLQRRRTSSAHRVRAHARSVSAGGVCVPSRVPLSLGFRARLTGRYTAREPSTTSSSRVLEDLPATTPRGQHPSNRAAFRLRRGDGGPQPSAPCGSMR